MSSKLNYYERLGVPPDATPEEIREAFHREARRLHPDVNLQSDANEKFLLLKEAFDVLSDSKHRAEYDKKINAFSSIKYNVLYSRDTIPYLSEKQLLYALIDISLREDIISDSKNTPLNIVIVLDTSTSMKGERLQAVKNSAYEIIRKLNPDDILSIVAFNDDSQVIIPASYRDDIVKLQSEIRRLQTHGGTEIYLGMLAGFIEIRKFLSSKYHNHMILITDGRTYGDEEACLNLADQCSSLGIMISCLGIGSEWNDKFLDNIAKRTGGMSKYISNSKELASFLTDLFDELGQTVATRVEINFELGKNVDLLYAFRLKPDLGELPTTSPIQLGSLPSDSIQRVLFEFQIPPISKGENFLQIMSGDIRYDLPKTAEYDHHVPLSLSIRLAEKSTKAIPPPLIVESMSKLTLYRMQEQAQKFVEDGEITKAKEKLQYVATHLLSRGERGLAKTVIMEVDNLEKQNSFSEQGKKEIKYGTRALLLSAGITMEGDDHD